MNEEQAKILLRQLSLVIDDQILQLRNCKLAVNELLLFFSVNQYHYQENSSGDELMKINLQKGNIRTRNNGTLELRFYENNKRISIYGKNKKEIMQKFKGLATQKVVYPKIIAQNSLFDYLFQTLEQKKNIVGKTTYKEYRGIIEKYIKPNIPNKNICQLTVDDIQQGLMKIELTRTQETAKKLISKAMKKAVLEGQLRYNLCDEVCIKSHVRKEGESLSVEQMRKIIDACKNNDNYKIFIFYLLTGARRAEGLSFKWEYIDYERNIIFLNGTKTVKSKRYIPLFEDLKILFASIPKRNEFVFPMAVKTIGRRLEKIKQLSGVDFTIRNLRTTFATRHAESGVTHQTLAKWLGHTTTKTTEQFYIKVLPEYEQIESKKRDSLFHDENY